MKSEICEYWNRTFFSDRKRSIARKQIGEISNCQRRLRHRVERRLEIRPNCGGRSEIISLNTFRKWWSSISLSQNGKRSTTSLNDVPRPAAATINFCQIISSQRPAIALQHRAIKRYKGYLPRWGGFPRLGLLAQMSQGLSTSLWLIPSPVVARSLRELGQRSRQHNLLFEELVERFFYNGCESKLILMMGRGGAP